MAKKIPNSRVFDSQVIAPPPNWNSSVETGRKVCSFSPQRRFQQSGSGRTRKRRKKTDTISDVRDRKRPKKVVDRISCLPDDVLSHILSFLPTKQAMATSVVSKRWQSLWMLVPRLDSTLYWPREAESFSRFVCDRVLPLQKSFDALTIRGSLFSSVGSWFWDFIACCSRELDLLELGGGVSLGLPSSLYTSKTLVSLKLRCKTFSVIFPFHLPSLKIFHLVSCVIDDGKSISGFISGCPVLEGVCLDIISLKPMDIPPILLASQTLVSLKLAYFIPFDIRSPIYLRCLKALHLVHVRNLTEKSIGQFLAGCPVLEDLFIEFRDGDERTKLPSNLFTCETLLSLTLSGPSPFHVPSTFCLPRLKIF